MLKKSVFVGSGIFLLLALLFGRDATSYVSTTIGRLKDSVRESVPVEFEIQRARKMIVELEPEIRRNMHLIAKEEVEVERLDKQISTLATGQEKHQNELLRLRTHLESGKGPFYHAGQRYSEADVRIDLANRFQRFKTKEETLANLRKVSRARQLSLDAARQKLEEMLAAKRSLVVDVENVEARQKMVEVAQTASDFNFDDSRLARTKDLITNIRTRIEVAEKLLNVQTDFHAGIPLDEPEAEDVCEEIAEYFGSPERAEAVEVAELN